MTYKSLRGCLAPTRDTATIRRLNRRQSLDPVPEDLKEELTRVNWSPPAICAARVGVGEVTSVVMPADNRLELVAFMQMADGRIFMPAASPNAYWYEDGVVTVESNVPRELRSGYLAEGDDMFLLDKNGVVHKGHPERGFSVFSTGARISDRQPGALEPAVHILKGSPSGDEMYLANNAGLFGYQEAAGWTMLAEGSKSLFNVEWVEPGLALAVGLPRNRDAVIEAGPTEVKRITDIGGRPGTLRYFEPWGYVLSGDDGAVYERQPNGEWLELFRSPSGSLTIPYGATANGGMLTGTADAKGWSFGIWYEGDEHCAGDAEIEAYVVAQQKLPDGTELMATQVRYGFAESFSLYERKTSFVPTRCGTEQW